MRTLLITGGGGQAACALAALAPGFSALGYNTRKIGRPEFDFGRPDTVAACFTEISPEIVVNAAAWTAVDLAEFEPEAATRANDTGPAQLAALCRATDIPLIHLSTDYVFDGAKGKPYVETDPTNPLGVYGATKLGGEDAIRALGGKSVILRTSGVYAAAGKNFVRTMLEAAKKADTLRVVADQRLCPTSAIDLAGSIFAVVERITHGWRDEYGGIFHAAASTDTTWHGFAEAIFDAAAQRGRKRPHIIPIATTDWPTPARRPADSRLDCAELERIYSVRLPGWQPSLRRVVEQILEADDV